MGIGLRRANERSEARPCERSERTMGIGLRRANERSEARP
jgi:hypothetical protein